MLQFSSVLVTIVLRSILRVPLWMNSEQSLFACVFMTLLIFAHEIFVRHYLSQLKKIQNSKRENLFGCKTCIYWRRMKFALISLLCGIKGQKLEHKDFDNEVVYNDGHMVRPLFFSSSKQFNFYGYILFLML